MLYPVGVAVSGMLRPRVQLSGFSSTSGGGSTPGPLSVPEKHGMDIIRDPSLNKVCALYIVHFQFCTFVHCTFSVMYIYTLRH